MFKFFKTGNAISQQWWLSKFSLIFSISRFGKDILFIFRSIKKKKNNFILFSISIGRYMIFFSKVSFCCEEEIRKRFNHSTLWGICWSYYLVYYIQPDWGCIYQIASILNNPSFSSPAPPCLGKILQLNTGNCTITRVCAFNKIMRMARLIINNYII